MKEPPTKPENLTDLLEVAKICCQDFLHVRVDLYNIGQKIYFGELTFFPKSGFHAGKDMNEFGKMIKLPHMQALKNQKTKI